MSRQERVSSIPDQSEGWLTPSQGVTHPRSKADSAFHPLPLSSRIRDTFSANWSRCGRCT